MTGSLARGTTGRRSRGLLGAKSRGTKAPALKPGLDLTRVGLTYEEGVVASVIDGQVTPEEIGHLVAMPLEKVAAILAKLREKDLLADGDGRHLDPYAGFIFPLPLMQAEADLREEDRKKVIYTYDRLEDWNHYELLGIRRRDDAAAVKRAFQEKVKEWHPDVWGRGRANLGPFGRMITHIFEQVKKANQVLSNEKTRAEYDEEHASFFVDEQDMAEMLAKQRRRERDEQRARAREARRKRMNPVKHRLVKAREMYRQAIALEKAGEIVPALRAAQTAAAFDPNKEEYAQLEKRLTRETSEIRIEPYMKKGSNHERLTQWDEAIECFQEAVRRAPEHGPARLRLAYNLLQGGRDPHEARSHAQKAIALLSGEPEAHYVLGLCYERAEMSKAAVREYARAVELKSNFVEAKKRLNRLRWGFGF